VSEWWTYRLDSFLLFSARTYQRLIETYNADVWPLQMVTLLAGAGLLVWLGRPHSPQRDRVVFALLGGALLWLGVARHAKVTRRQLSPTDPIAILLIVLGVILYPWIGPMLGRPWQQAEVFAVMPDPTVITTLGFLLLAEPPRRVLLVVPVLWCAFSGAMLWALHAGHAWVPPAVGALALVCLLWRRRLLSQRS
jgi:hypothetical protein